MVVDNFVNALRVNADIFYTDKKMLFQRYSDMCGRGLSHTSPGLAF